MAVVLARYSAPGRVRSAALTAPAAESGSVCTVTGRHGLRARDHRCNRVTKHAGHASVGNSRIFGDTQTSEAIVSLLNQHLVRLGRRPMQAQHRQHQR
jgi:hypothetical protein